MAEIRMAERPGIHMVEQEVISIMTRRRDIVKGVIDIGVETIDIPKEMIDADTRTMDVEVEMNIDVIEVIDTIDVETKLNVEVINDENKNAVLVIASSTSPQKKKLNCTS